MTTGWLLISMLLLPAAAAAAAVVGRTAEPPPVAAVVVNAVLPGSGLVLLGRPLVEVVLCVLMGEAAMLVAGGTDAIGSLVPFMLVAGAWAAAHTPLNPLHPDHPAPSQGGSGATGPAAPPPPGTRNAPGGSPAATAEDRRDAPEVVGYSVAVRCTECGAELDVPVLETMAHCGFCGSDHLVTGHDETLWLTVPARAHDEGSLREALLDHYRYQEYLRLYRRSVAPLERQATEVGPTGVLVTRPETSAAAAAAEAAVARKADAFRARLAQTLRLGNAERFLSPYRHGVGTLYQATFGRDPSSQDKCLRFTVGTVEASVPATTAMDLPGMGKLSYLRALRPAAACDADLRTLPLDLGEDALRRGFGDLDRKQLDRSLQVIRTGIRFRHEVAAVVWRPWWLVEVRAPGITERVLVDGASGSVVGAAPYLNPAILGELPPEVRAPGTGLRFVPMECPSCGDEFPFERDAVVHFCRNCHRTFEVQGARKTELRYIRDAALAGDPSPRPLPFWRFPLRLRTSDGRLVTDLWRLKDGIDGVLDQLGDGAPDRRDSLLVPAVRCISSRLTASAYNRLFRWSVQHPPAVEEGRFPLDLAPRPYTVSLEHDDARRIAPLYLANVFGRRDLAKVNLHQVATWLFDAELEADGELCYASVPDPVTEPFRAYLGRPRPPALDDMVS